MAAAGGTSALRSWNPTYNYSDRERWVCIYPSYINAKKTESEGRRIAKTKAVDNPTLLEIRDVLTAAGIPIVVEQDKCYPRERDRNFQGRVRVQLKDKENTLVNEQFKKKDDILEYVCQMIPKLKTRSQSQSSSHQQSSNQPAASSAGSKKSKGKKK